VHLPFYIFSIKISAVRHSAHSVTITENEIIQKPFKDTRIIENWL